MYGEVLGAPSQETDELRPRNPYAESKAQADRLAGRYWADFGLPVIITRASNNYGPYQYPEKLIPFFLSQALRDEPLPLYGDGRQVRDWLHVRDHCRALRLLIEKGAPGQVYNIGGGNERENIEVARLLLAELGKPESLLRFVTDRPGHDRRYALDCGKLRALGWKPEVPFEAGLKETVAWYVRHQVWCERARARSREYFAAQYGPRV